MPCRGPESDSECTPDELKAMGASSRQKEIDELTAMLCGVCRYLENQRGLIMDRVFCDKIHTSLYSWWVGHKKLDKQRLEKAKVSALAKLTADEKEALGISE